MRTLPSAEISTDSVRGACQIHMYGLQLVAADSLGEFARLGAGRSRAEQASRRGCPEPAPP